MPRKKKTTEKFIEESIAIHGNKYSYDKTIYNGSFKKITITCNIHGDFLQTPSSHLQKSGCYHCGVSEKMKDPNEYIKKLNEIHPTYTFPNIYKIKHLVQTTYIEYICPNHGIKKAKLNNLLNGKRCRECSIKEVSKNQRRHIEDFIEKSNIIHDFIYDYSKVIYENGKKHVTVVCGIHGDFKVSPVNHTYKKSGCPDCSTNGFNKKSPATLYYIRIRGTGIHKIGVTGKPIKKRFKGDVARIEIVLSKKFKFGEDALKLEQYILNRYKKFKYKGKSPLTKAGNGEMFFCDIFNM